VKFKRVVACGDEHCGHRVGLTPPKYQSQVRGQKYYEAQKQCWDFWQTEIEKIKPIHLLINNGDACDGKGTRSGGNELIHPKRTDQAKIATDCIEIAEPEHVILTRGTPYHVGVDDDFEDTVCDNLNRDGIPSTITDHAFVEVNGILFDAKHKIGASSIPHGRSTASKRENMWNLFWNEIDDQPRKTGQMVYLRSHVHYFDYTGDDTFLAIVLPALQAQATTFGSRQCSGVVKYGFCYFDCYEDGSFTWSYKVLRVSSLRQDPIVL
jgi:hypothetical protein